MTGAEIAVGNSLDFSITRPSYGSSSAKSTRLDWRMKPACRFAGFRGFEPCVAFRNKTTAERRHTLPSVLEPFQVVALSNGEWSLRAVAEGETFHPVVGPAREGKVLYADQLEIAARLDGTGELTVWDVGLGGAANAAAVAMAAARTTGRLRIVSFDLATEPLRIALRNADRLGFPAALIEAAGRVICDGFAETVLEACRLNWELHKGDFSILAGSAQARDWPAPHVILWDPFSPAKNPSMWTLALLERVRQLAAADCTLATYSRATLVRSALLMAGWHVGVGVATGEKEETTVAATRLERLRQPLASEWLGRALRSTSAEPLATGGYRQAPLSPESWARLAAHPQFNRV